jgi:translation initiation factor 1 (eIF-1/SUI1)
MTIEVTCWQSKKFLTRIRGMEVYGIAAGFLAKDIPSQFSCAATVEEHPGNRAALKLGHAELCLQGNWVDELEALLLLDESLTDHGGVKGVQL